MGFPRRDIPDAGMCCSSCGGKLEVKDSRPAEWNRKATIRRRRACRKCGLRITTFEIEIDRGAEEQGAKFYALVRQARNARDALDELLRRFDDPPERQEAAE
jgi:hypothetical protein